MFKDKIKKLRENLGLSQVQLSKRCHISNTYIGLLESGHRENVSVYVIVQLAKGLEVNPLELLEDYIKEM